MRFLRRLAKALGVAEVPGLQPSAEQSAPRVFDFAAVDVETANVRRHSICQVGFVAYRDGREVMAMSELVDPEDYFDEACVAVHGITSEHVRGRPGFRLHHHWLGRHLTGANVAAHSTFDRQALSAACERYEVAPIACTWIDTAAVARTAWPHLPNHKLATVAAHLGHSFKHHDALEDARAAAKIALAASETLGVSVRDLAGLRRHAKAPRYARQTATSHASGTGPLEGHYVTITGDLWAPRPDVAAQISTLGGGFSPSVTKRTTILIIGDGGLGTNKHQAALLSRDRGQQLEILTAADFRARFGL